LQARKFDGVFLFDGFVRFAFELLERMQSFADGGA
jgi:hypothetical protein